MAPGILVLGRNQEDLETFQRELTSLGYQPIVTADREKARELLKSERPALLFGDILSLSGTAGSELLRYTRDLDPEVSVIILTGIATIEAAVEALGEGASFYLLKPFTLDHLKFAVERAIARRRQPASQDQPVEPSPQKPLGETVVGTSLALQRVLDVAEKVADSDVNILISGESGTGKELFARAIHARSGRSRRSFVPVDCASLPESLLEAELFGYEKGAFTGAVRTKPGLMELANRGTLFFDEIAELPLSLQPKLLRALQQRQHRRLMGTRMVDFDIRVISATNRDLRQLAADGRFRQDLFYRLNVVPIRLPPLRKRDEDTVLLANHFLEQTRRKSSTPARHFAPEILTFFEEYSWPGNVRELQNVVEHCCAMAQTNTITSQDLPEEMQPHYPKAEELSAPPAQPFRAAKARWLAQFEAGYVADLLKRHGNNISQAAKAAGVDRKTFYSLLQKHHVRPSPEQPRPNRRLRLV
jgi:two-component system, NtrC family, response regulator AtoC